MGHEWILLLLFYIEIDERCVYRITLKHAWHNMTHIKQGLWAMSTMLARLDIFNHISRISRAWYEKWLSVVRIWYLKFCESWFPLTLCFLMHVLYKLWTVRGRRFCGVLKECKLLLWRLSRLSSSVVGIVLFHHRVAFVPAQIDIGGRALLF